MIGRRRLALGLAILVGSALAIQAALPGETPGRAETTWDTAPRGHAALFELLERFDATRGRWLTGLSMPPTTDPVWLIAPRGVCGSPAPPPASGAPAEPDSEVGGETGSSGERALAAGQGLSLPWIEAGGTAIVWLSHPPATSASERPGGSGEPPGSQGEPAPLPEHRTISRRGTISSAEPNAERPDERVEAEPSVRVEAEPIERVEGGSSGRDAAEIRRGWRESLARSREALREGRSAPCEAIAGWSLPDRRIATLAEPGQTGGEVAASTGFSIRRVSSQRGVEPAPEEAPAPTIRRLPGATLAFFERPRPEERSGWQPVWVETGTRRPFALERTVGAGRVVVVADARVLTNGRLAALDAAPFAFDWIERAGAPWIDEHTHGVVPESGTFRYLVRSPARTVGIGLLVLGGLLVWRGQAWPVRDVEEVDPESPTLSTFVDSVAWLYSGSRDLDRVFERYRAVSLERIRRALGLAPETPAEIVLASLRARAPSWPALRETGLRDLRAPGRAIASDAELLRATARLDALVEAVRAGRDPSHPPQGA
ncbi:MAG: hypothetical protein ACX98W_12920 [bacterium]